MRTKALQDQLQNTATLQCIPEAVISAIAIGRYRSYASKVKLMKWVFRMRLELHQVAILQGQDVSKATALCRSVLV